MKLQYFLYILGIIFILSVVSNIVQYFKPPTVITKTITTKIDTTKIKDSLTIIITAELREELKPEIKYQLKYATTNIDSIYEATKEYWLAKIGSQNKDTLNYYNYTAQADTAAKDSLGWVFVRYNSRIPLDPQAYFNINYGWYNRDINTTMTTTIEKRSFLDDFNWSVNAGIGANVIGGGIGIYIGVGLSYDIKKVF